MRMSVSVVEKRHVLRRRIAPGSCFLQQLETAPLKVGKPYRVLRDPPCSGGPVCTSHREAGPAVRVDDFRERVRVSFVNLAHARVVALKERAVSGQLRPHPRILRYQREQFFPHRLIRRQLVTGHRSLVTNC